MGKIIYRATGKLEKNFVGHITYTTILPEDINGIKLSFFFNKRESENLDLLTTKAIETLKKEGCLIDAIDEMGAYFANKAKTEINLSVFINDFCVGSAHRDLVEKIIKINSEEASVGFNPIKTSGVMKIVLHCLSVLNDDTEYILMVESLK